MALLGKIKNILGFSDDSYEDEVNNESAQHSTQRDARVTPIDRRPRPRAGYTTPQLTPSTPAPAVKESELPQYPDAMPEQIFTKVVEIFNATLPEFLRESVDREAQCRYIHNALDESMKEYIANLDDIARRRFEAQWGADREKMQHDMEEMRNRTRHVEESGAELREQKLSAERQKRALSERVHDLEKQIATLEAEREQFDLENKSLVNKIRVMSTTQGADAGEIENRLADAEEANKRLTQENARLEAERAQSETARTRAEEAQKKLSEDIETFKTRCDIADTMINELNNRLGSTREELEQTQKSLLEAQKSATDATMLADQANLAAEAANKAAEAARQALVEAKQNTVDITTADNTEELEALKAKVTALEADVRSRISLLEGKDKEIAQLKEENEESQSALTMFEEALNKIESDHNAEIKQRQEEIDKHVAEIESLRATIENNLRQQAASEEALRKEIEELRKGTREGGDTQRRRRRNSRQMPDLPLDDSLDDTNWLIASEPVPQRIDDDFGYHEPKRRPQNDDPAQMSLW